MEYMSSGGEPLPTPSTFSDGLAPTRIVVACTFDPLGLQGPLHVWLHSLTGLRCEISWVGYGMVLDAVADASSAWGSNDGGLNVLLLRWCDMHRANYSALEDAAALLLEALRASIARRGAPTLVLLPPPAADGDGGEAATALTAELRAIGGACVVVDSGELRCALGSLRRFHSPFLDQVAHSPYSPEACSVFAASISREVARWRAPRKKVYCLDCDNTLWGGAVGELGPHGVALSDAFLAVQRRFVERQRRGALLCLVSRNVEEDVRAVLRERRDELLLREEHVVAIRAAPDMRKSAAVLDLAATLCLDATAFTFVDDSPFECADVAARAAPRGVAVVHVPREPEAIAAYLDACWALDEPPPATSTGGPAAPTAEDLARTSLYRQLDERKSFVSSAAAASSMDAFAASFNLRVDIGLLDEEAAARAAQLTERTNQHNACKCALSAPRLLRCTRGRTCLTVDASDRFGHHGLIG
eukprot:CAMPEP_0185491398 /NCGR_PEP_ID=MMETSP1366-20130426/14668_1 /TAXON_ID=38817 /ORGANISM="Gephyrocapsa oceanica, Strain RCC1303" /LENGTH=472 /DNA_ID=CAMNT_0028100157 /DNA_START=87 /DNA_END=1501 /DNA_ORIENTATION=+